jgi:hypothetical protein
MNVCIECSLPFEPDADHWLFCTTCQRKRTKTLSAEISRVLSNVRRIAPTDDIRQLATEAESRLIGEIYDTL